MSNSTNSAHERTASIDLAQLDTLPTYDPERDTPGMMELRSEFNDGDYFKVEDVRALARRSLTSGAPEAWKVGLEVFPSYHQAHAAIRNPDLKPVPLYAGQEEASTQTATTAKNAAVRFDSSMQKVHGSIGDYTQFHTLLNGFYEAAVAMDSACGKDVFDAGDKLTEAQNSLIAYIDGRTAGTRGIGSDGAAGTVEKDAALDAAEALLDVLDGYDEQLVPINRKSATVNRLRAAIEAHNKAGKEQGCTHENCGAKWDHILCSDCMSVRTDYNWGIAAGRWFKSLDEAKFYKEHGKLPK